MIETALLKLHLPVWLKRSVSPSVTSFLSVETTLAGFA
jgi:hypothetical protein